ncbi:MAG TPA: DUF1415 domain-containing protein [Marinagarivorans sp.]
MDNNKDEASALAQAAIESTRDWFERVVLGLNLCPYAHQPAKSGRVRFTAFIEGPEENLFERLEREVLRLEQSPADALETTLVILPEGFEDFYFYLSVLERVEHWLRKTGKEGVFQVASFHPQYVFHGAKPDDRGNLTNRSPYPVLHLLREQSLAEIIDGGADTQAIPARNIARLTVLSESDIDALFPYLKP